MILIHKVFDYFCMFYLFPTAFLPYKGRQLPSSSFCESATAAQWYENVCFLEFRSTTGDKRLKSCRYFVISPL